MKKTNKDNAYNVPLNKAAEIHMLTLFCTGAVTFVLEVLFFFLLSSQGVIEIGTQKYFIKYLLLPTGCNTLLIVSGYIIYHSKKADVRLKSYALSICLVLSSFVIALVHGVFSATCLIFAMAIMITVFYGEKILTTVIFLLAVIGRVISVRFCIDKNVVTDDTSIANLLLSFVILFGMYVLSLFIIRLENEKREMVTESMHAWNEMRQTSRTDVLTGLHNRQALEDFFDGKDGQYYRECKLPVFFALWDIDDFKRFNDIYGHLQGDDVLRYIGAACRAWSPWMECFRYGGDEFCAVIFDSDAGHIKAQLWDFQQQLAGYRNRDGKSIPISVSIGLTRFTGKMETAIAESDKALYRAKKGKKGNIVFFKEEAKN